MSFAIITIMGNIGKDAELKDVRDTTVTSWSVAVSRGKREEPTWYQCSMWGIRGEKLAQYIRKGDKITVAGALTMWEGKPQIRVYDVGLGGASDERGRRAQTRGDADPEPRGRGEQEASSGNYDDDDMPF